MNWLVDWHVNDMIEYVRLDETSADGEGEWPVRSEA
jgi:hypothetical protein